MDQIIHWNNFGAWLIERDLHKDALSVLGRALAEVRNRMKQPDAEHFILSTDLRCTSDQVQEHEQHEQHGRINHYQSSHMSASSSAEPVATHQKLQSSSWGGEENERFIYRKPVSITDDSDCYCETVASVGVVLVFNMALSNQLCAMMEQSPPQEQRQRQRQDHSNNNDDTKSRQLTAALKLYQLCFTMQRHGDRVLGVSHALALLNNSGHIHCELSHDAEAGQCFQHLLSALMCIVADSENDTATFVDQMDGFFSSATRPLPSSRSNHCMAAAA
jgi:hypothetical protein